MSKQTVATRLVVKLITRHARKPLPKPIALLVVRAVSRHLHMGDRQPTTGTAADVTNVRR